MISVENLSLYFGAQNVFNNVSFMINKRDKIGLVGKNGSGKSTLLKLLTNNLTPNEGNVTTLKNVVVGYLEQDIDFEDKYSLIEDMHKVFSNLEKYKTDLNNINKEIIERTDYESPEYLELINQLSITEEKLRMEGGYDSDVKISRVLKGLGFKESDFNKHTSEFSGGWRMRIELAKILLKNPDILLLDEPTNHLDIVSIIWLESWLQNYTGAIVLVSHDKRFLDSVINRTIEVSFSKINDYKANYAKYLNLRKDRQEKQIQAKKNQDKHIIQTKMLINKFRAKKNKAAFAQTLIKKLEKLEIIEVEKEDVTNLNFRFPPAPHSGKITFRMKNISKSYGETEVLKNVSLEINRGEKIAFVGKNGEGKTTLAKIIVSEIEHTGLAKFGHNVEFGYYAQNQEKFLDPDKTILQTIEEAEKTDSNLKIRDILGSFLFSSDDVNKKISVLSGGERARVSLCKLLLSPVNFLIMDEPTNHLDIISKDVLKRALINYDGSLIIISHDRDFLQGLSEKIYEFKDKNIKEYIGDVNTFLEAKKLEDLDHMNIIKSPISTKIKKDSQQKISYHKRKELDSNIRKFKKRITKLESEITEIEEKKKKIDLQLADPAKFQELSKEKDFFKNYESLTTEIKEKEEEWEELVLELNKLQKS